MNKWIVVEELDGCISVHNKAYVDIHEAIEAIETGVNALYEEEGEEAPVLNWEQLNDGEWVAEGSEGNPQYVLKLVNFGE